MNENKIYPYIKPMLKSEWARVHPKLCADLESVFKGGAIYLPNGICKTDDLSLLQVLVHDLEQHNGQIVQWSRHLKYENPQFSKTFNDIVQKMADRFNVQVFATRMNIYPDGKAWKPYHHDSHAFVNLSDQTLKEDFTMGASFGSSRKLSLKHPSSEQTFDFPQNNGDIFAFDSNVNEKFMHGVPKSLNTGPRISIIAWGKRMKQPLSNPLSEDEQKESSNPSTDHHIQDLFQPWINQHSIPPATPTTKPNLKDRLKARQATRGNTVQSGWSNISKNK
jgi:hypothetical protein